jgi:1-acyl-sn-glycerol-3-phosphate acyltransferase
MFPVALLCWALTLPFDRRKVILHRLTCFWGSLYTWFNPAWPVEVTGRGKIDPDETYVMVANHQSLLDILVLFRLFRHFKWVSKVENFRIPCIGWNMYLNGYIQLKRGDLSSTSAMLRTCRENLANGNSIMMFPEGTRSPTGRLRGFKTGAFDLAKDAQRPLLPIVVHGTASALPKRGVILQGRHQILIEVLDPIAYSDFAEEDVDALALRVRELIGDHLEKAKVRAR